jgi:GT2 family glycosyltransferase
MDEPPRTRSTITVVIAGINRVQSLRRALLSIVANSEVPAETIYVDGGSTDGSRELTQEFPRVRLLDGNPSGVGQNRNLGAAVASGELLLFLDDDAVLPSGFLQATLTAFSSPSLDVLAPQISDASNSERLQFWGNRTLAPWFIPAPFDPSAAAEDPPRFTLQARGAAMVVRASAFRRVGGFQPTLYPYGGEDFELCWRIWMSGGLVATSRLRVAHEALGSGSPSAGRAARYRENLAYSTANYVLIYLINGTRLTLLQLPIILAVQWGYPLRQGQIYALLRGVALVAGRLKTYRQLRVVRASTQARRVVSDLKIGRTISTGCPPP